MFRIDDATAATSLPAPETAGTEGYFTEGNPATGTPATKVRGSWLNMIQEELRAIVVAAGLTPSKTTYNQVLAAIKTLVGPGRYLGTQVITASGTVNPGTYNGVTATKWRVRGCGAGGAGGGAPATSAGQISFGTAGLSGAYAEFVTPAVATSVTVGAAGAPGAAGASGGTGGNSAWGTLVTLQGGAGGAPQGPTTPPFMAISSFSSVVGGTLTPLVNMPGSNGQLSLATSTSSLMGGAGGDGPLGRSGSATQNGGGISATGYGCGGGAASNAPSLAARSGGAGTQGVFLVDEFA